MDLPQLLGRNSPKLRRRFINPLLDLCQFLFLTCGFELVIEVFVGVVFGEGIEVISDGDSLSEGQELHVGHHFFQRGLSDQDGGEIIGGIELGIMKEPDFIQEIGFEEMSFVDNEDDIDFLLQEDITDGMLDLLLEVV